MFALLNRFAWIIAIMIWLQFSFIADRDWPFDEVWFWIFIITLFIVKFSLLGTSLIKSRLEFFANSIKQNYINQPDSLNEVEEKIDFKKQELKDIENNEILEEIRIIKEIERENENKENSYKAYAEKVEVEKIEEIEEEPSKLALAIKAFFSENLLAKLGWILVFLWVLFLLGLVYAAIWPVWKLLIWFTIWFSIFIAWVILDKKELPNEARILLGVWILINYLVILSWRYLIWDTLDNNILSIWTTFFFLIFNTAFAVVTSLLYKSRTLLLFSFIFAFINPLLVGWSSDNPYTLIGYSLIVAFGWLFLSLNRKDILLATWVFMLANILFLIAPFTSDMHWIVKLVSSTIISIASIFVIYKIDLKQLSGVFLWSYIFLVLLLWSWGIYIKETTSFISYMMTIVLYFGIWIYYFLKTSFNSLIYILIAPILILLWLSFTWGLVSIVWSLAIIILIYLLWFNFIQEKLPNFLKYIFFSILGIYIFLTNSFLSIQGITLDLASFITVIIVSFIFIFTSYYLSTKKGLEFLYSIWTIGWILTLAPIIVNKLNLIQTSYDTWIINNEFHFNLSIIALIIFTLSNWIIPFKNKILLENPKNLKNLIIWMITWLLFIWYELFSFWTQYFPWVTLGFAFAILAIIYFIMAYIMMGKIWIDKIKTGSESKNVIYSYLGISISVFSLAIALIFSNYESIISAIWLFEATLMFYFFNKTKEVKILVAWIILFMVWIFKLFNLIDLVDTKDYIFLIPFSLVFVSFVLNIKFLNFEQNIEKKIFHDLLHILWIWTLAILLLEIIPSTWHGWSILWITIFISISSIIYSYFNSKVLKVAFIAWFTWFLLLQIWSLDSILWRIDKDEISYLRILQYISTILLWVSVIAWNKLNKEKSLNVFINLIFTAYLLIITSLYVYDIFDSTFAVTIYWWVTASFLISKGIANDIIKLRTIWLYLIGLTTLKIFLYDIWYWIDDAISRVVALIVIWILLIIISTKYTKKYWNDITKELSPSNLKDNLIDEITSDNKIDEAIEKEWLMNKKIKNIDVSNIKSVKFIFSDKNISIRTVNLIKIVKVIIDDLGQTKFDKNELRDVYINVKENYQSDLSKVNYDKIIKILERFVEEWWEVKLIEK